MPDSKKKKELKKQAKKDKEVNRWKYIVKKILKFAKKDFAKFTVISTATLTVGIWLIKSFWYFYQCGIFSVYGIDKSYINTSDEKVFFQIIQLAAILIILACSNYIYYQCSIAEDNSKFKWKRHIKKMLFFLGECMILFVIVATDTNSSIEEVIKEVKTYGIAEILVPLFLIYIMINIVGIEFVVEYRMMAWKKKIQIWYRDKCGKNENRDKIKKGDDVITKNHNKEKNKYRKYVIMCIPVLVTLSIELFVIYFVSENNESNRVDYKVVYEEIINNEDSRYVFKYEKKEAIKIYPIIYENKDIYILSRLYKKGKEIKMDYEYQKVIKKENVETRRCENIYKINIGK